MQLMWLFFHFFRTGFSSADLHIKEMKAGLEGTTSLEQPDLVRLEVGNL